MRIKTTLLFSIAFALFMLSFGADRALAVRRIVTPDGMCDGKVVTVFFTTIQAAVDAAGNGDRIEICPGTYNEAVTVNKSRLKIEGKNRVDDVAPTTLDGQNALGVGIIILGDLFNVTIDDLIIRNYTEAAIKVVDGPTRRIHVEDCAFHDNTEGVIIESTDQVHAFSRVRRSVFTGTTGTNIRFENCTNGRVQRTDIDGGEIGIHFLANINSTNLVNNRMLVNEIRNAQLAGIRVEAEDGGALQTPNATRAIVEDTTSGPGILFITQGSGTIDRAKILRSDVTCSPPATNEGIVLDEGVPGSISRAITRNNTTTDCL